ncbi:hypothetical protein WJ14_32080 [Burkholderia cenocepacia]|nr:hypothetical protein WJ14_32080 [Burkholderia cenocepacia]
MTESDLRPATDSPRTKGDDQCVQHLQVRSGHALLRRRLHRGIGQLTERHGAIQHSGTGADREIGENAGQLQVDLCESLIVDQLEIQRIVVRSGQRLE